MSFVSLTYFAFLAVVLLALFALRSATAKRATLLVASYVFYAWWDWRFVFLLAGMTLVNYAGGRWIDSADERNSRKLRLGLVVGVDLLVLGAFKYLGFFVDSAHRLIELTGIRVPAVHIILPIAISFITFEVISYVVDIYRRELEPVRLRDVALLVAFFPHLIAGPILKPKLFLPQLREDRVVTRENLNAGLQQFTLGLLRKVLIADRLAAFVDPVMHQPDLFSRATLWLAVAAYAAQIYSDFAGYSDMAIGSARCMGFDIPPNFSAPYASRNITEFWRRWHISLSTWLREYLYIPLGGNRRGKTRQAANLLVVMLLGGLWHGANWNFVVWGGLHGAGLAAHKLWLDHVVPRFSRLSQARVADAVASWMLTTAYVGLAWVFFRVTDVSAATRLVMRLLGAGSGSGLEWLAPSALVLVPLVVIADIAWRFRPATFPVLKLATFRGGFVVTSALVALALFWPTQATPFIYFQF